MAVPLPSGWVRCECCGEAHPVDEVVEYWGQKPPWDGPRVTTYYCRDCNIECHSLGEDCRVLERREEFEWRWARRPVTDEELSEVREMVERSMCRVLNLNVRLNSEEEPWRVSSTD